MYYDDGSNKIHIGRNKGCGAISSVALNGNVGINNISSWVHSNLGNVTGSGSSG
jgi:hypothetical protein